MLKLNLKDNLAAQDMISIIMNEKGLSEVEAVKFAINKDISKKIISTGWAPIAFNLWGHDDPDRVWNTLNNPAFEIMFEGTEGQLIDSFVKRGNVDIETTICYFLIFTMEELGYHI